MPELKISVGKTYISRKRDTTTKVIATVSPSTADYYLGARFVLDSGITVDEYGSALKGKGEHPMDLIEELPDNLQGQVRLLVGKAYLRRDGEIVVILEMGEYEGRDLFVGGDGMFYYTDGYAHPYLSGSSKNLIKQLTKDDIKPEAFKVFR